MKMTEKGSISKKNTDEQFFQWAVERGIAKKILPPSTFKLKQFLGREGWYIKLLARGGI